MAAKLGKAVEIKLKAARKAWASLDAEARAAHAAVVARLSVVDSRTLSVERRDPLAVFGKSSAPARTNGARETARRVRQLGYVSSTFTLPEMDHDPDEWEIDARMAMAAAIEARQ